MTTKKRLSKPRPKGLTIVPDGQEMAYGIFYKISEVEEGLQLAGAKAGEDYTFMDLANLALDLIQSDDQDKAIKRVAKALEQLGFGDMNGPGAVEGHTMMTKEALALIGDSLSSGLESVADALRGLVDTK